MRASYNATLPHFPIDDIETGEGNGTESESGEPPGEDFEQMSVGSSSTSERLLRETESTAASTAPKKLLPVRASIFHVPFWMTRVHGILKCPRELKFNKYERFAMELVLFLGFLVVCITISFFQAALEPYSFLDTLISSSLYIYVCLTYIVLIVEERVLRKETMDHQDRSKYVWKYNYSQILYWLLYTSTAVAVSSVPMNDPIVVRRLGLALRVSMSFVVFSLFIKQSTLNNKTLRYLSNPKNPKGDIWITRTVQSYLDVLSLGVFYVYTTFQVKSTDQYSSYAYVLYLCFIFLFNLVNSVEVTANVNALFVSEYMQSKGAIDYRVKVFTYVVMHELVLVTILGIVAKMISLTQQDARLFVE